MNRADAQVHCQLPCHLAKVKEVQEHPELDDVTVGRCSIRRWEEERLRRSDPAAYNRLMKEEHRKKRVAAAGWAFKRHRPSGRCR